MNSPVDEVAEARRQSAQDEINYQTAMYGGPTNLFTFQCGQQMITTAFIRARHLETPGVYLILVLSPNRDGKGLCDGPCVIVDRHGQSTTATAVSGAGRVFIEAVATA